jgi:propanol-preferring alcohol dehydrogenase
LWGERSILSVANLTRDDGREFLALAAQVPLRAATTAFSLSEANEAVSAVRDGGIRGAAVLVPPA